MSDTPKSLQALLNAWNEKDSSKVRSHLETALAPEVIFADPNYLTQGIDEFEAMVHEFHQKYPISKCEHTSGLDSHHNRFRYSWLVSINKVAALPGLDVTQLNDDGKIVSIDGFFGSLPNKQ